MILIIIIVVVGIKRLTDDNGTVFMMCGDGDDDNNDKDKDGWKGGVSSVNLRHACCLFPISIQKERKVNMK